MEWLHGRSEAYWLCVGADLGVLAFLGGEEVEEGGLFELFGDLHGLGVGGTVAAAEGVEGFGGDLVVGGGHLDSAGVDLFVQLILILRHLQILPSIRLPQIRIPIQTPIRHTLLRNRHNHRLKIGACV